MPKGIPKVKKELTPDQLRLKKAGLAMGSYRNNIYQQIGQDVEEGEEMNSNTKIITKNLEIMDLPEIDIMDAEAVQNRIREYFEIEAKWGFKPTLAGLGNALGLNRARLYEIRTGNFGNTRGQITRLPIAVTTAIKKAYVFMEQNWEDYMQNGKINPVAGIFLGKNNYGYQDKTEYVITPTQEGVEYSEKEIRERLGLPDAGDTSSGEE